MQVGFNTVRSPILTHLYYKFYRNDRKTVPESILLNAREQALAIFIGNDGLTIGVLEP